MIEVRAPRGRAGVTAGAVTAALVVLAALAVLLLVPSARHRLPGGGVPADFAGAWTGELTQVETGTGTYLSQWAVTVRLDEGAQGGTADLPGLRCRGRLTLTASTGDVVRFRYRETADGRGRCVDSSRLVLRREGEQHRQLEADWRTAPESANAMASSGQLFR